MKYETMDKFPIITRTATYLLNTFMATTNAAYHLDFPLFHAADKKINANF